MNILFVDAKSWTPYDNESVRHEAVGGTEATLVTIAQGLSQKHNVMVEQYGRTREFVPHAALRYVGPQAVSSLLGKADPDVVVILRRSRLACRLSETVPDGTAVCLDPQLATARGGAEACRAGAQSLFRDCGFGCLGERK